MERVQRVVRPIEPHDSVERYTRLGVECLQGAARITSPWSVRRGVGGGTADAHHARHRHRGGRPALVPAIPGIEKVGCLTSDTVWELRQLPQRLRRPGRRADRLELAQCFARLGSKVTQVEMLPRILNREDPEVSRMVAERFEAEGMRVLVNHEARAFRVENGEKTLLAVHDGRETRIAFDQVLVAVGRIAEYRRLRAGGAGHTHGAGADRGDQRVSADPVSEYLRLRRRGGTVSVHPHRLAPGVVRGRQRALRRIEEVPGRLFGHPVGDLHGPGSRARGIERDRGKGEATCLTK